MHGIHRFLLDASISPTQNSRTRQISQSKSSSSTQSSETSAALVRINAAPPTTESETSKQRGALERRLKRKALVEAAEARSKKTKDFLRKYCSLAGTWIYRFTLSLKFFLVILKGDCDELYEKIVAALDGNHKRSYFLFQNARHSCFGLIEFMNSTDRVVGLFQYLNETSP